MIILGLTGSIGMGKSTTAGLFRGFGVPVQDADETVTRLYARGGAAVASVETAFPGTVTHGAVDRAALAERVLGDAEALTRLEAIVHPLVRAERGDFLLAAQAQGADVAVLDVPLLYETGADRETDAVVVVTAPQAVQAERVLGRQGMTADKFARILARQLPDADKRARADFVIDTSGGIEAARGDVARILAAVRAPGFRSRSGLISAPEAGHP